MQILINPVALQVDSAKVPHVSLGLFIAKVGTRKLVADTIRAYLIPPLSKKKERGTNYLKLDPFY